MLRFTDNLIFYSLPSCPEVFIDLVDLVKPENDPLIWKYVAQGYKKKKSKKKSHEQ